MKVLNEEERTKRYAESYDSVNVDDQLVLYETRDGSSIVDSPLAIFLQMMEDSRCKDYRHIWVIASEDEKIKSGIPAAYREKVEFVLRNSERYLESLLQAKYLISNSTFQSFFLKKPEQVYINTWHGTPLKYMGFDIPGNPAHSQNVLRNLLMTDFFLSPNEHTTRVFQYSYRLNGLYEGTFLESGYPRIDATINTVSDEIVSTLKNDGVKIKDELPIILYMPTWRGASVASPTSNVKQIIQETLYLRERLAGKYEVLVKVHPYVYRFIKDEPAIQDYLVPDHYDANQILAMVDLLITDFSSVFFDYLVTDKPIIFYAWDQDLYQDERGMYFAMDELPGPVFQTVQQMAAFVLAGLPDLADYRQAYGQMKKQIVPYDDGAVAKRIVDRIFFDREFAPEHGREIRMRNDKQKLLIYAGGMMNNGITTSLLNLLSNLDKEKFDISLFCQQPKDSTLENFAAIPKEVRLLFKPGPTLLTDEEEKQDKRIMKDDFDGNYPEKGYRRECQRVFAGQAFDAAIDFSGYSFYWSKYAAFADAKKQIVYIHNDIWEDAHKVVDGETPHLKNLLPLFRLYQRYDEVVSVSESLMAINAQKLVEYVRPEQMKVVMNSLNLAKILEPKAAKKISTEAIQKVSIQFKITEDLIVPLYPAIPVKGETAQDRLAVRKTDQLTAVAVSDADPKAYKLLVNDIYVGWALAENLSAGQEPVVLKREKGNFVVSLRRNQKYLIYLKIPANTGEGPFRGRGKDIEKRYVWVKETVETMIGEFCHIFDFTKEIGWIDKEALANWHPIKRLSPVNGYFVLKNQKRTCSLPDELDFLDQRVSLATDREFPIYVGATKKGQEQIKIASYMASPYSDYRLTEAVTIQGKVWWQLQENGLELGWVRQEQVKLLSGEQTDLQKEKSFDLAEVVAGKLAQASFSYVTMGRLSPEKNQENLIRGFAEVISDAPNDQLFIIGEGPLRGALESLVAELGLGEKVVFLGQVTDPFPIIKMMDTFVLPSLYEGQPMALLEALTMGMKVVASDIPQNKQIIGANEEYGLLTQGTDAESIAEGLRRAKNQEQYSAFDYQRYNQQVLRQFEETLG